MTTNGPSLAGSTLAGLWPTQVHCTSKMHQMCTFVPHIRFYQTPLSNMLEGENDLDGDLAEDDGFQEAKNRRNIPLQEKIHRGILRGVTKIISDTP